VPADIRFMQVVPSTGQVAAPWGPRGIDVALRVSQMQSFSAVAGGKEPGPSGGVQ
jgi:hypothetical protein